MSNDRSESTDRPTPGQSITRRLIGRSSTRSMGPRTRFFHRFGMQDPYAVASTGYRIDRLISADLGPFTWLSAAGYREDVDDARRDARYRMLQRLSVDRTARRAGERLERVGPVAAETGVAARLVQEVPAFTTLSDAPEIVEVPVPVAAPKARSSSGKSPRKVAPRNRKAARADGIQAVPRVRPADRPRAESTAGRSAPRSAMPAERPAARAVRRSATPSSVSRLFRDVLELVRGAERARVAALLETVERGEIAVAPAQVEEALRALRPAARAQLRGAKADGEPGPVGLRRVSASSPTLQVMERRDPTRSGDTRADVPAARAAGRVSTPTISPRRARRSPNRRADASARGVRRSAPSPVPAGASVRPAPLSAVAARRVLGQGAGHRSVRLARAAARADQAFVRPHVAAPLASVARSGDLPRRGAWSDAVPVTIAERPTARGTARAIARGAEPASQALAPAPVAYVLASAAPSGADLGGPPVPGAVGVRSAGRPVAAAPIAARRAGDARAAAPRPSSRRALGVARERRPTETRAAARAPRLDGRTGTVAVERMDRVPAVRTGAVRTGIAPTRATGTRALPSPTRDSAASRPTRRAAARAEILPSVDSRGVRELRTSPVAHIDAVPGVRARTPIGPVTSLVQRWSGADRQPTEVSDRLPSARSALQEDDARLGGIARAALRAEAPARADHRGRVLAAPMTVIADRAELLDASVERAEAPTARRAAVQVARLQARGAEARVPVVRGASPRPAAPRPVAPGPAAPGRRGGRRPAAGAAAPRRAARAAASGAARGSAGPGRSTIAAAVAPVDAPSSPIGRPAPLARAAQRADASLARRETVPHPVGSPAPRRVLADGNVEAPSVSTQAEALAPAVRASVRDRATLRVDGSGRVSATTAPVGATNAQERSLLGGSAPLRLVSLAGQPEALDRESAPTGARKGAAGRRPVVGRPAARSSRRAGPAVAASRPPPTRPSVSAARLLEFERPVVGGVARAASRSGHPTRAALDTVVPRAVPSLDLRALLAGIGAERDAAPTVSLDRPDRPAARRAGSPGRRGEGAFAPVKPPSVGAASARTAPGRTLPERMLAMPEGVAGEAASTARVSGVVNAALRSQRSALQVPGARRVVVHTPSGLASRRPGVAEAHVVQAADGRIERAEVRRPVTGGRREVLSVDALPEFARRAAAPAAEGGSLTSRGPGRAAEWAERRAGGPRGTAGTHAAQRAIDARPLGLGRGAPDAVLPVGLGPVALDEAMPSADGRASGRPSLASSLADLGAGPRRRAGGRAGRRLTRPGRARGIPGRPGVLPVADEEVEALEGAAADTPRGRQWARRLGADRGEQGRFELPDRLAATEERVEREGRTRTSGSLLTALARSGDPEEVVRVILERSSSVAAAASTLGGEARSLVDRIARTASAERAERTAASVQALPQFRTVNRRILTPVQSQTHKGSSHAGPGSTSSQGVGASGVMKLAGKLMKLIHLAENERRLADAQRQVRMAEETGSTRREAGAGQTGGEGVASQTMNLKVLQQQVLDSILHKLEEMRWRREDPDGPTVGS